jgi:Icc-related predicted phosphoesterase
MTRVLLVGDIHVMDKPPVNATETYTDDIIDMLRWTANYAHAEGIPLVVWAGDVFHHKQPSRTSHALVLKMLEVVRLYESLGIELRIVIGNHDISNDVLSSVPEKQPLGVLIAAGARELDGWHETLPVFGVPWQQRWLHEDTPHAAFQQWRDDPYAWRPNALAVTHAPIYPKTLEGGVKFDLVPTAGEHGLSAAMGNQGYLYYGHIHEDHGIFEVEGVTYANMGALSRGSLHEYNLERRIQCAVWSDGDDDQPLGFTPVEIPHKPASEVFKIEQAAEAKADRLSLDAFLSDVGTRTLDISSTATVIEHIRTTDVEPKVRDRAIEILENVE